MIPFIDLQSQRLRIEDNINSAVVRVIEHGQYIMGPEVSALEDKLSSFSGAKHSIACANGTDALVLSLRALEVGPGDAVFVPSFTFVATVEAVKLVGATPVFVDVCIDTFNICGVSLNEAIESIRSSSSLRPKAIIAVDLFGQPADYMTLDKISKAENLKLIADAAQSFGARQNGLQVGKLGRVATTSFFPAKPLGCYGDGGAIFTDDDELAALFKSLRNHGQGIDRYDNVRIGVNSRLDTIQAAILLEKLEVFADEIIARERVAARYNSGLSQKLVKQSVLDHTTSVWAQYTVVSSSRDSIREHLSANNIPTAVYYPKPNHLQAPYVNDPCAPKGLPNTEYLQERVFSLPMHPYLDVSVQDEIIRLVNVAVDKD